MKRLTPAPFHPPMPTLPARIRDVITAMVYGSDSPMFPGTPQEIPPGTPLSIRDAAVACGVRPARVQGMASSKIFVETLRTEMEARRYAEEPANLAVAMAIRDDRGDGSPEAKAVRLKAVRVIRGAPAPGQSTSFNASM
jgi:hypothetical protein